MVTLRTRSNEEMQEPGSLHWKRLSLGEWLLFGFLWFSSFYVLGLLLSPGMDQAITLFLLPFLGGAAVLVGVLVWLVFSLGALAFVVGLPGGIVHNSMKYSVSGHND